jgi:RHS repeat-associated protein
VRHQDQIYNHTPGGDEMAWLNGTIPSRTAGPGITLLIGRGDVINAEVFARYGSGTGNNPNVISVIALTEAVAGIFGGINGGGTESQFIYDIFEDAFSVFGAVGDANEDVPRAYLNYIFFNEYYEFEDAGFVAISISASNDFERLAFEDLTFDKQGFLYIYCSNESNVDVNVFFDDLAVNHIKNPVIQSDDYYPFGLTMAGLAYKRLGSQKNKFKYNGKELQDDLDLNWYDYGARMYDASVGRWWVVDAMVEKYYAWSPFNYTVNNPIKYIDLDGRWIPGVDEDGNVSYTAEEGDSYQTFMEQYGLKDEVASKILGMDTKISAGETQISGLKVKEITGSEVLEIDLENATDDDINWQVAFALTLSDVKEKFEFNMNDFMSNIDKKSSYSARGIFSGVSTNPKKPTKVRLYGEEKIIWIDYGTKSDGRILTSGNDHNLFEDWRMKTEYFHPNSLEGNGNAPSNPSLTVYIYSRNWRKYKKW